MLDDIWETAINYSSVQNLGCKQQCGSVIWVRCMMRSIQLFHSPQCIVNLNTNFVIVNHLRGEVMIDVLMYLYLLVILISVKWKSKYYVMLVMIMNYANLLLICRLK